MPDDSVNAAQLRAARALLGLTQDEAAKEIKITRKTLANLESGEAQAFLSTVRKATEFYRQSGIDFISTEVESGVVLRADR